MKHIRKFNELNAETYSSAADKLRKLGRDTYGRDYWKTDNEFKDRSAKLSDMADYRRWEKSLLENNKLGKTRLKIENRKGEMFEADFNLFFFCNGDSFLDSFEDSIESEGTIEIPFEVSAYPADKESLNICKDKFGDIDNIYGPDIMWLYLVFKIEGERLVFDEYKIDNTDNGVVKVDRVLAGKIRSSLLNIFTEGNDYPSGYNNIDTAYEAVERYIIAESGLSSEYGLSMDHIKDAISSVSANKILTYIKK